MDLWWVAIPVLVVVGGALAWAALVLKESRAPRVVCLMYHRFVTAEEFAARRGGERAYTVSIEHFQQQLEYLRGAGYHFVNPDQVRAFIEAGRGVPCPAVLITIDDGCVSPVDLAWPVLQKQNACATVFVTTDPDSSIFKLPGSERRLSDEELVRMDGPVVQFESHAVSHRALSGLAEHEIRSELRESKLQLERLLGRRVDYMAVPGNWHDRRVMRIAREEGYRGVWCSRPGAVRPGMDPFNLPRINVDGRLDLQQFAAALTPCGVARRRMATAIRWLPHRLLGPRLWLPIRKILRRGIRRK